MNIRFLSQLAVRFLYHKHANDQRRTRTSLACHDTWATNYETFSDQGV